MRQVAADSALVADAYRGDVAERLGKRRTERLDLRGQLQLSVRGHGAELQSAIRQRPNPAQLAHALE
jgi:hypothetical protein